MKLSVERDALTKALSTVGRVIQSKPVSEIMSHLLIRAAGSEIAITGADMEMRMAATVPASIDTAGTITLSASTLTEYAQRLPAGSAIAIELVEGGQRVSLKAGRSRATMMTLNPDFFPVLAGPDPEFGFEIEGMTLSRLLSSVEFAVVEGHGRAMLSGVLLQVSRSADGPILRTAGADGLRVGRASAPCPRGADGLPEVIIPKRACAEIKRLADTAGKDGIGIALSRNEIQATAGAVTFTSKLIDAVYPDLDQAIPRQYDKVVLADGPELQAALARSAIVADDKYRSSRFAFTAGHLEIVSRSATAGDVVETVDVEYDGPDFVMNFNSKFARDILGILDSDTVRINCGGPGGPTLWVSPADASREFVLMPLRV